MKRTKLREHTRESKSKSRTDDDQHPSSQRIGPGCKRTKTVGSKNNSLR